MVGLTFLTRGVLIRGTTIAGADWANGWAGWSQGITTASPPTTNEPTPHINTTAACAIPPPRCRADGDTVLPESIGLGVCGLSSAWNWQNCPEGSSRFFAALEGKPARSKRVRTSEACSTLETAIYLGPRERRDRKRARQQEPHQNRQTPAASAKEKVLILVGQHPHLTESFPQVHRQAGRRRPD